MLIANCGIAAETTNKERKEQKSLLEVNQLIIEQFPKQIYYLEYCTEFLKYPGFYNICIAFFLKFFVVFYLNVRAV